jgi:hypothetical protein
MWATATPGNTAIIATVPDTYEGDQYPQDTLVTSIAAPASTQPALTFNISAATLEGSNTVYAYSPITWRTVNRRHDADDQRNGGWGK